MYGPPSSTLPCGLSANSPLPELEAALLKLDSDRRMLRDRIEQMKQPCAAPPSPHASRSSRSSPSPQPLCPPTPPRHPITTGVLPIVIVSDSRHEDDAKQSAPPPSPVSADVAPSSAPHLRRLSVADLRTPVVPPALAQSATPSAPAQLVPAPAHVMQPAPAHAVQSAPAHAAQSAPAHAVQPAPAHAVQPAPAHAVQPAPGPAVALSDGSKRSQLLVGGRPVASLSPSREQQPPSPREHPPLPTSLFPPAVLAAARVGAPLCVRRVVAFHSRGDRPAPAVLQLGIDTMQLIIAHSPPRTVPVRGICEVVCEVIPSPAGDNQRVLCRTAPPEHSDVVVELPVDGGLLCRAFSVAVAHQWQLRGAAPKNVVRQAAVGEQVLAIARLPAQVPQPQLSPSQVQRAETQRADPIAVAAGADAAATLQAQAEIERERERHVLVCRHLRGVVSDGAEQLSPSSRAGDRWAARRI
eukprot:TRINITY_DN6604_c0_g1_i4.p1 TRINITY_DN6604_c0_g1~~TRINITY_DN6604_c0_g1_i4.p1  ORF type:complete len:468 (+),score=89.94 TRINITY_DN6604_c0_g1_i4:53-1456(+)